MLLSEQVYLTASAFVEISKMEFSPAWDHPQHCSLAVQAVASAQGQNTQHSHQAINRRVKPDPRSMSEAKLYRFLVFFCAYLT